MHAVRSDIRIYTVRVVLALAAAAGPGLAGCSQEISGYRGAVLAPADIGLPADENKEGYAVFSTEPSTGRFPAAIAVARVEPAREAGGDSPRWRVATLKEEEAVYWNSLFNTTPEIRESMVLREQTPLARGQGVGSIAGSAQRLNASLCLVYGPAHAEPDEAALVGNLLDARSGESIARIFARASQADFEVARSDRPDGDQRHRDVQYLAARKFEHLFHECILDLIRRDQGSPTTRPSKWQGSTPPEKPIIYVVPE